MTFYYPSMNNAFQINDDAIGCIVIENKNLLVEVISDIYWQTQGLKGKTVISIDDSIVDIQKDVELLTSFIPFDINQKSLIAKIIARIEKKSYDVTYCEQAAKLMADIELFVDSISFDLPCNLVYKKLCFQSVLKSIGCEIEDCHESISERILDYMNLIREFDGDKLFVIVNYRSLFNDRETELLMESIHMHKYKAIMIDGSAQEKLIWEDRCTIDDDLCIF